MAVTVRVPVWLEVTIEAEPGEVNVDVVTAAVLARYGERATIDIGANLDAYGWETL